MSDEVLVIHATVVKYSDKQFYLGVSTASDIFDLCRVSRAEEDPERGFQRTLGTRRAEKISEYFKEGNVIPGSLILSAKDGVVKSYDNKRGQLTLGRVPGGLLIIDGQHRLYGAHMADVDVEFPLCIFDGLDVEQEVQYFLDVNGYQIGVPKTLQLELTKFLAEPDSEDAIYNQLFDLLAEDARSPLFGLMARTKSVRGKISHVAFRSAASNIINAPPFGLLNIEKKKNALLNFLIAVDEVVSDYFDAVPRLTNAAFFQAIVNILNDVLSITLTNHHNFKLESIKKTLEPIRRLDYSRHAGTNKGAIKALADDLKDLVLSGNYISNDEMF